MKNSFSSVIVGCMDWGSWRRNFDTSEMTELIQESVSLGLTSFDHADIYGDYTVEEQFGKALDNAKVSRQDLQIISKCGIQYACEARPHTVKHYQYDTAYIIESAERSIEHLRCDYLDLFLLHRPSPLMRPEAVAEAVSTLKAQGKIKAFGVSNFTPSQTALIASKTEIAVNQIQCSLTHLSPFFDGSLDHMMTHGIQPMAWSPIGKVFKDKSEATYRIHAVLNRLCEEYQATKDQLVLAWLMTHPSGIIPVVGTTQKERLATAAKAAEINLSEIHWFELLVASQGHKVP